MPSGPYVVLPLLGPSTPARRPAFYVDTQTDLRITLDLEATTEWALVGMSLVNRRAEFLPYDASFDRPTTATPSSGMRGCSAANTR